MKRSFVVFLLVNLMLRLEPIRTTGTFSPTAWSPCAPPDSSD